MEYKEAMSQLSEAEARIRGLTTSLLQEIADKIEKSTPDGVTPIPGCKFAVTAKLSSLGNRLDPAYYISACQAEAVTRKLSTCPFYQIPELVKKMVKEKRVVIGRDVTYLNETTLGIIMESELGQYALDED